MQPYPTYKDSGIEWLGEIPDHWEMRKVGRSFDLIGSGTTPRSNTPEYYDAGTIPWVLTGDLNNGILQQTSKRITQRAYEEHSSLKIYPRGTLLIALYGATIGQIALLGIEACTNQACCALACSNVLENRFVFYWFLANRDHVIRLGYGGGQPNISQDLIRSLRLPTPPITEQYAIVEFLDEKTTAIDTLIAKKRRQIELLQEQRAALINQAVTKGLDRNRPMKDSGVPWIGEIPAEWLVIKFKHCTTIRQGQVDPTADEYRDLILVAPNHIESGTGRLLYTETADEQGAESGKYEFRDGDVLYSKIRPHLQKACIAIGDGLCSADMYPITPNERVLPFFLLYLMLSENFTSFTVQQSMRVAMPKINREDLNDCYLALPDVQEQRMIMDDLQDKLDGIDSATEKLNDQIERLSEYRTALISAAVTGKIDVRHHATQERDHPGRPPAGKDARAPFKGEIV